MRVQQHRTKSAPSCEYVLKPLRIPIASAHIEFVAQSKDLPVLTSITLCWRDEADSAVSVFVVVPTDKITYPASCSIQGLEALSRVLRAVLQCFEKRLRVWGVIIDTRRAAGWCYAQLLHLAQQSGRFHRRSVVRVQHQRLYRCSPTNRQQHINPRCLGTDPRAHSG